MLIQTKRWKFIINDSEPLKQLTKNYIQDYMLHIRVCTYKQLVNKLDSKGAKAEITKESILREYINNYIIFFSSNIKPDYISFDSKESSNHKKQRSKKEIMDMFYDTLLYMNDAVFKDNVDKTDHENNKEGVDIVNEDLSEKYIIHDKLCLIKASFPPDELLVINVCSCKGSRLAAGLNVLDPESEISYQKDFFTQEPVLLGSAIKGVFSHFCKEREIKEYNAWFGTEDQVGKITFFDAIPIKFDIYADYMTNHYPTYYRTGQLLLNEDPVPLLFHSIKINTMEIILHCDSSIDIEKVKGHFEKCLKQRSFGAKGAVGYGYFKIQ